MNRKESPTRTYRPITPRSSVSPRVVIADDDRRSTFADSPMVITESAMAWTRGPMAQEPIPAARGAGPGTSILLIDDDVELCELMREFFEQHNFRLELVHEGRRGLSQALHGGHDLVLLDVMMPGVDGINLLRQVRRRSLIPVIVLTARTAQADRVLGLDAGADDYLPKPFGPDELLARVRAVLRRADGSWRIPAEILEMGPIRLVPATREAWCDERAMGLTTIEFDILELLVRSAGRAVSRAEV